MKKLIVLPVFLFIALSGFCQLEASFEKDTLTYERDKNIGQIIHLPVSITGIDTQAPGADNSIRFAINASAATTMPAGSYAIKNATVLVSAATTQIECEVTLLHGQNPAGTALFISIQLSYANPAIQTKNLVLKIINKPTKKDDETTHNRIMYLNAYNFDFTSTTLASNYVGHLNLFAPSSSKNKKWGYNSGIMKINYSQKDTSNSNGLPVRENVFINPFDTLGPGVKYLKQINGYKIEKQNTVWSIYVQPTFELTNKADDFHVYAHAHLELVPSKWSSTTTVTNIKQDTGVFTQPSNSFVIRNALSASSTYTVYSLSGYFGLGFTLDAKPWENGNFFFQPTLGATTAKPAPYSTDINSGSRSFSSSKLGVQELGRDFTW